jgi:hypothetical protein
MIYLTGTGKLRSIRRDFTVSYEEISHNPEPIKIFMAVFCEPKVLNFPGFLTNNLSRSNNWCFHCTLLL